MFCKILLFIRLYLCRCPSGTRLVFVFLEVPCQFCILQVTEVHQAREVDCFFYLSSHIENFGLGLNPLSDVIFVAS